MLLCSEALALFLLFSRSTNRGEAGCFIIKFLVVKGQLSAGGIEKLAIPSGKSFTPEEVKLWRAVSMKTLNPEIVMSLHLPNVVKICSDEISR